VLRGSAWRSVDFVSPHFLLFVRQRRSADIAVNKLSVPKRTGKFSTWSNDAATQQVVANGERHGKVENQLVQHHLDISMATPELSYPSCVSLFRYGAHQRRGVDLIGYGGLGHIDDCEEKELSIVKDRETLHLGGGKGE
jgi:hypothetical protein